MDTTTSVRVRGLRKSYGQTVAVDGVDLDIHHGEVFALLGPNGAGKTTTVEILEGYRRRDGGEVTVLGTDPGAGGREWRSRIGIVLQSNADASELSVREMIRHFSAYYPDPRDPDEVIESVGLIEKAGARLRQLSGGQRRRVDVALGIVGNPELIFLDEPTTGFDPEARRQFWHLIQSLADSGTTILLTTHYLDEAEALANRVGVIAAGQIRAVGAPADLGGRATAQATVSWLAPDGRRSIQTGTPTQVVAELAGRFGGEVPELTVTRPSLEDIYLAMIGVVALNTVPVALAVESIRRNTGSVAFVLGTVVLGLAFSVVFGTWISRIIEQSRERAQLIERLEAAQAELAEVSRQAGTLAERQRLAGEIHDTIAQGLTSIVMLLQAADTEIGSDPAEARRHVGLATQTAREGLAEARAMVAALTPAHLDAGPLHEALGRLTDRIGAELGIEARFEVCGPARPLPANAEVVLLRAAQEALANVRKHARAADVRVVLSYEPQAVRLDVRDDGAGFDPDRVSGGYGLRGMRSRILQVGGSLLVRARPGAGTSLSVEVPG